MKRRVLALLIFLLLGAIVNIAVAWGCAIRWPQRLNAPGSGPDIGNRIPAYAAYWRPETTVETGWVRRQVQVDDVILSRSFTTDFGARVEFYLGTRPFRSQTWQEQELRVERVLTGWPCLAMSGGRCQVVEPSAHRYDEVAHVRPIHAVLIAEKGWQRVLPVCPIWPGFAINTLFYAAILWLLLALPGALRRWRRIQRGLCPACAYPVGTSPVCTECGKPVARMR